MELNKSIKLFIINTLLIIFAVLTFSSKTINSQSVRGLAIEPVYTKNQITKNGILFPKVKPGEKQKLSFNIINFANKSQKIKIKANNANTSDTPSIYYSDGKFINDRKKSLNFSSFINKKTKIINVKPNKETRINFYANIPSNKFSGVIAGGFYIDNNLSNKSSYGSTTVNNKYSYVMPVVLKESNNLSIPKLNLGDVYASNLDTDTPQINSVIYNKRPAFIYNMTIDAKVTNEKKDIVAHKKSESTEVAPNTHFTLRTLSNLDKLSPGNYHIKIIANSENGKWKMEKDFKISNSQYLGTIVKNNLWWIILLIIILIIIISFIIYYVYKKHKSKSK